MRERSEGVVVTGPVYTSPSTVTIVKFFVKQKWETRGKVESIITII